MWLVKLANSARKGQGGAIVDRSDLVGSLALMPRQLRIQSAGAYCHVMARGNRAANASQQLRPLDGKATIKKVPQDLKRSLEEADAPKP